MLKLPWVVNALLFVFSLQVGKSTGLGYCWMLLWLLSRKAGAELLGSFLTKVENEWSGVYLDNVLRLNRDQKDLIFAWT